MKRILSILLAAALLFSLSACAQPLSDEIAKTWSASAAQFDDEGDTLVVGAEYDTLGIQNVCVRDEGIFYISGGVASYYDFESEEAYYLCSNPSCKHDSADCVAYAEHKEYDNTGIYGLAYYGGSCFYLSPRTDDLSWELVAINPSEQTKTVVTTFGADGSGEDDVVIEQILDAYYYRGKAWIEVELRFLAYYGGIDRGYQILAIDLTDGAVSEVTEQLHNWDSGRLDVTGYGEGYLAILNDYEDYPEDPLTFEEFQEQGDVEQYRDELAEQFAGTAVDEISDFLSYTLYLEEFYDQMETTYPSYPDDEYRYACQYLLNTETMELTELYTDAYPACGEVIAISGGRAIQIIDNWNEENYVYYVNTIDLTSGESMPLFSIPHADGYPCGWQWSLTELIDGTSLLTLETVEDGAGGEGYYYCLRDATTGERTVLTKDERTATFRIVGQTQDRLIGRMNMDIDYVWVSKEDFLAGNANYHKFMSV